MFRRFASLSSVAPWQTFLTFTLITLFSIIVSLLNTNDSPTIHVCYYLPMQINWSDGTSVGITNVLFFFSMVHPCAPTRNAPDVGYKIRESLSVGFFFESVSSQYSTWTQYLLYYCRLLRTLWHTAILALENMTLWLCTHIRASPHASTSLLFSPVKTSLALPTHVALQHLVVLSLLRSFGQLTPVWRQRDRNSRKGAGLFMDFGLITVTGAYEWQVPFYCISQRISRSFEQYCDPSRQYDPAPDPASFPNGTAIPAYKGPGVDTFIKEFGRQQLLDYSLFFFHVF